MPGWQSLNPLKRKPLMNKRTLTLLTGVILLLMLLAAAIGVF